MTKKDYIAIANVIKDSRQSLLYASTNPGETKRTIDIVVDNLIHMFALDNPNFDSGRFWDYVNSDKRYKDFTDK